MRTLKMTIAVLLILGIAFSFVQSMEAPGGAPGGAPERAPERPPAPSFPPSPNYLKMTLAGVLGLLASTRVVAYLWNLFSPESAQAVLGDSMLFWFVGPASGDANDKNAEDADLGDDEGSDDDNQDDGNDDDDDGGAADDVDKAEGNGKASDPRLQKNVDSHHSKKEESHVAADANIEEAGHALPDSALPLTASCLMAALLVVF